MIAADRDCAADRCVDEQDGRCLARRDRVEEVKLEAEEIVGSNCGREDDVEVGHQKIIAGAGRGNRVASRPTTNLSFAPLAETPSGFRFFGLPVY
jgi:hypothetical protein